MTDESQNENETSTNPSELDVLKARAKTLGLTFSGNIGVETLRAKIEAKLNGEPEPKENAPEFTEDVPAVMTVNQKRRAMQEKHLALVRCRIVCMNPSKQDLQGEIVTVGNKYLGTIRKYVLFNEIYHLERILFEEIKSRRYLNIQTKTVAGQVQVKADTFIPEFVVEELPQLTVKELADLKTAQLAKGTVE